jgi:Asp-tRNA(Asn)/Glu-tRNA(Gln) amidotransferase B subunit
MRGWSLEDAIRRVIKANPKAVELVRSKSDTDSMSFLIREVMIITENEIHPRDVRAQIKAELGIE